MQRQRVAACAAALEARIAPYVSAVLAGGDADSGARLAAQRAFEASLQEEVDKLRRCSMGEQILAALGYAKGRRKRARGVSTVPQACTYDRHTLVLLPLGIYL